MPTITEASQVVVNKVKKDQFTHLPINENEFYVVVDEDFDAVTDVKVDGTSVVTNNVANIDLSGKQDKLPNGTTGQILKKTDSGVEWANESKGTITDVQVNNTSVVTDGVAKIDLTNKQDKLSSANAGTNITITEESGVVKISSTGGGASSFSQLTGSPYDNTNLKNALDSKQNTISAGNGINIVDNVVSTDNIIWRNW